MNENINPILYKEIEDPEIKSRRFLDFELALRQESAEAVDSLNWKWWKKATPFNEAEAREELIDIWHFVVQASLELNLTPDDILDEYKRKNEINRERQRNGY